MDSEKSRDKLDAYIGYRSKQRSSPGSSSVHSGVNSIRVR